METPTPQPTGSPADETDARLRQILAEAGAPPFRTFRRSTVQLKPDGSPLTAADQTAQAIIVEGLRRSFPSHSIEAEEDFVHEAGRPRWYVDPLDGTRVFVEGLAYWGPTVAFVDEQEIRCGALWLPRVGDYWYVGPDHKAWLNGRPLEQLLDRPPTNRSTLFVPSRVFRYLRIDWPGRCRNLGSTAAHLALVSCGGVDACFVGPGWQPWDVFAGLALVAAAGGEFRTLDGRPLDFLSDVGTPFVAGTRASVQRLTRPGSIAPLTDRGPRV